MVPDGEIWQGSGEILFIACQGAGAHGQAHRVGTSQHLRWGLL